MDENAKFIDDDASAYIYCNANVSLWRWRCKTLIVQMPSNGYVMMRMSSYGYVMQMPFLWVRNDANVLMRT